MIERAHRSAVASGAVAMCCFLMAGCACTRHEKAPEPVTTAAPAEANVVAEVPTVVTPEAVPVPLPQVVPKAATIPPPQVVPKAATVPPPPGVPKAATVPSPQAVPKATPAPAPAPVATKPPQAPLDLASLGTRLKQTRAIGVLTKLSLKNQVDDLLEKFRAYHRQQGTATLPELRRSYDMLLLKVLSLLQDSDPPLARDIVQSRAAIWGILADPRKFNEASLMAGATT
jgi:hypothetical protein